MIIRTTDIKLLSSKLDVSKSMELKKYISKYLLSNASFIKAISKLFEKCNEMIPYIWKTEIVIPLHKMVRPVSLICILCKFFKKLIRNHIKFIRDHIKF